MQIFLVREHLHPGDEFIHAAYTNKQKAEDDAAARRHKTKTNNFDVVEVEEGEQRVD